MSRDLELKRLELPFRTVSRDDDDGLAGWCKGMHLRKSACRLFFLPVFEEVCYSAICLCCTAYVSI